MYKYFVPDEPEEVQAPSGGMMGWGELGLMYKSIYTIYK
jgi:hypothetical protein